MDPLTINLLVYVRGASFKLYSTVNTKKSSILQVERDDVLSCSNVDMSINIFITVLFILFCLQKVPELSKNKF